MRGRRKPFLLAGVLLSIIQGRTDPKYTPVPFTLGDRERLIAIQEQLSHLEKRMDLQAKRMDRQKTEIADLRRETRFHFWTMVSPLIGVLGAIVALIAYLLYERNKLLVPLLRMQYEHDKRLMRLEALILPTRPSTT